MVHLLRFPGSIHFDPDLSHPVPPKLDSAAIFAERNGQSVSEFCEMHVLDACHRMAGEGEALEAGAFAEEIQGIFKQAFMAFRENVLELLEEREASTEETDEAEFREFLDLPEKLEEKLNAFLEETQKLHELFPEMNIYSKYLKGDQKFPVYYDTPEEAAEDEERYGSVWMDTGEGRYRLDPKKYDL
ncbi:MAG: hypothetical protein H6559_19230 [Lewinellaceae bacterium]|nr:hypothetical protein [Lewinellaceae bacterium]